jgi:hypothetical protein
MRTMANLLRLAAVQLQRALFSSRDAIARTGHIRSRTIWHTFQPSWETTLGVSRTGKRATNKHEVDATIDDGPFQNGASKRLFPGLLGQTPLEELRDHLLEAVSITSLQKIALLTLKRHSAGGHSHAEGDSSCGRNQFRSHRSLSLFRIRPPQYRRCMTAMSCERITN